MKIFITGATGYIGFAVARAFRRDGHDVFGLCRDDATGSKAKRLWAAELHPVVGDLRTPASFEKHAGEAEVIVHAANDGGPDTAKLDRQTVEFLLQKARDSKRPRTFLYTSGVWIHGNTEGRVNESSPLNPLQISAWRAPIEEQVLDADGGKLATSALRPGCVYGGSGGLTGLWFDSAEKNGSARIIGEGHNRWAMVHLEDLADAYLRAALRRLRGEAFAIVDRSRFTVLEMAKAASRAAGQGGKVNAVPLEEARKTLGPFADALAADQHVESYKAMHLLGWNPRFAGFVDDAELYYQAWKQA